VVTLRPPRKLSVNSAAIAILGENRIFFETPAARCISPAFRLFHEL